MQAGGRARPARRGGWHRDRCNPKPQRGRTAQLNAPARRGELGLRGSLDHRSRGRSGRRQTLAERYVACCGGMRRRHLVAKLLAPQRADINVIILQFGELLHTFTVCMPPYKNSLRRCQRIHASEGFSLHHLSSSIFASRISFWCCIHRSRVFARDFQSQCRF